MPSRLLTGEAAGAAAPMEWTVSSRAAEAARVTPLYGGGSAMAPDPKALKREAERDGAAYQRGFQEGQEAANRAAQTELQVRGEQMARAVEAIGSYKARLRSDAERDLVQLSIAIARRLVHRELQVDPGALLGLIKAALERKEAGEIHRVRLAPGHAETARRHLAHTERKIEVIADPALEPGSAIVETSRGQIDAGVDAQLREIERGFTDLLPS